MTRDKCFKRHSNLEKRKDNINVLILKIIYPEIVVTYITFFFYIFLYCGNPDIHNFFSHPNIF